MPHADRPTRETGGRRSGGAPVLSGTWLSAVLHGAAVAATAWLWEATAPRPVNIVPVQVVHVSAAPGASTQRQANALSPPAATSGPSARTVPDPPVSSGAARSDPAPETSADTPGLDLAAKAPPPRPARKPPAPSRAALLLLTASAAPVKPASALVAIAPVATAPVTPVPADPSCDAGRTRPHDLERRRNGCQGTTAKSGGPGEPERTASARADGAPTGVGGQDGDTAPRFGGQALGNPAPGYPYYARRRGQEGRVILRVRVSAAGAAERVSVRNSSGYPLLDEAAIEAVRAWRFEPASRRGTPISGLVDVPVFFRLTN